MIIIGGFPSRDPAVAGEDRHLMAPRCQPIGHIPAQLLITAYLKWRIVV
jgi:hypothetical protein